MKQIHALVLITAQAAFAQRPLSPSRSAIEFSPDGRESAIPELRSNSSRPSQRFNGVPFLTTPDWSNDVRRQVAAVAVADLNGDQRNDLIVGCYISNSFPPYTDWENMIYYNTPGGLEPSASWISADEVHTGDIQVGDINKDGYPDVFAANGGTSFSPSVIYYGSPTGPDTTPDWSSATPQATWATSAVLFDFDHDNDLDIFTTNQGVSPTPYRPIYGFRNNNGVLETTPFYISDEASVNNGLAFADYNHDGWEDLAVAKWVNFQTGTYLNLAGALNTAPTFTSGVTGGDRGVAWADVDNNGWPDLAVGRSPMVLYSNAAGTLTQTWTSTPAFASNPQELKFEDVDRDGDPDLAEIYFANGQVHIYLNTNGTLATIPSYTYDDTNGGNAIAFGDLNGDGWDDMVVGTTGQPCVKVFYARIPNVPGDMNCDGRVNAQDVSPFILAMLDSSAYATAFPFCQASRGDLTSNGLVDGDDVQPFAALLIP